MKKILVVCTGNTCRSSMAEAIFMNLLWKENLAKEIEVKSAGVAAFQGTPASKNAILALEEQGIDLKAHRASLLNEDMLVESDLVLTMTGNHKNFILEHFQEHRDKIYTLSDYAGQGDQDIIDPFGGSLEVYKACSQNLTDLIKIIIEKLKG